MLFHIFTQLLIFRILEFNIQLLNRIVRTEFSQNFINIKNHYYLSFYYKISKLLLISSDKYLRSGYISPI